MILCKKCSFKNYDGTKFCQRCGERLPYKKLFNLNGIAGMGMRGVSIAPLAAKAVKKHADQEFNNTTIRSSVRAKTVPMKDDSWYCPDCGQYNDSFTLFCSGCNKKKNQLEYFLYE